MGVRAHVSAASARRLPGFPLRSLVAPLGLGGQGVAVRGGPQVAVNSAFHAVCQGQCCT